MPGGSLAVEPFKFVPHHQGCQHRALGIRIGMRHRQGEDRHHSVTDELIDHPVAALNAEGHMAQVVIEKGDERAWISRKAFGDVREIANIGEEDDHVLRVAAELQPCVV